MPPGNLQKILTDAVAHHQAGRLADAERLYRQVLAHAPNDPDALHLLGALSGQTGNVEVAIDLIRRAITLRPNAAEFHSNIGGFYQVQGKFDLAAASFRRAVELKPDFPEAHYGLSMALRPSGRLDEAIASARRAIELAPDNPLNHNALAMAYLQKPQWNDAIVSLKRALDLNPNLADVHNNLGIAFSNTGQTDLALTAYQYAIRLNPNFAAAHSNLAARLRDKDRLAEAAEELRTALRLDPNLAAAHFILGLLDFDNGRLDEAMAHFNRGLELDATMAVGQWNRGLLRLTLADFEAGWRDYEWRLKDPTSFKIREFPVPQWDGSDLAGRRILIHCEQGLGDTVQFIRFAPLVAARGGKVIFARHAELTRLLPSFPGVHEMVSLGQPMPPFDLHIPLLSLPHALRIGGNFPAQVPYIAPDADLVRHWASKMQGAAPRVGLAWAGRPTHKNDRNRSIRLDQLSALLEIPGVTFYSLQKGPPAAQLAQLPAGHKIIDWTAELTDFADTAALMSSLDLIITVDTAVAHVAAAMGKPTWILLPFMPDWRWMLNRDDTPWYPTARLFRQKSPGDWTNPVERIVTALSRLATSSDKLAQDSA